MSYWLAKSDPDTYGWSDLLHDRKTSWDGVRNYKARNYIRAMKPGDLVLFYHSGDEKAVVGAMKILCDAYQDSTADEDIWSAIDVARLSVMPLEKDAFDRIVAMGDGTAKIA